MRVIKFAGPLAASLWLAMSFGPGAAQTGGYGGQRSASVEACPIDMSAARSGGPRELVCSCSIDRFSIASSVHGGADGFYTDNSGLCFAAKHAGVLGPDGGFVHAVWQPGRRAYYGSTRNGVTAHDFTQFYGSFTVETAQATLPDGGALPPAPPCPTTMTNLPNRTAPFACLCASAGDQTYVLGGEDGVYAAHTQVCTAAVHAGAMSRQGGVVRVTPLPGRSRYNGVAQNGVDGWLYGAAPTSFSVQAAAP